MRIEWEITNEDIAKIKEFVEKQDNKPCVQERRTKNLATKKSAISKEKAWYVLVGCLLTTQQRSGPNSNVQKFLDEDPFPLSYKFCKRNSDIKGYSFQVITKAKGIRRTNKIAEEVSINLMRLEGGMWIEFLSRLNEMTKETSQKLEREIAEYVDDNLHGFGPKQSRNFLQWLGLTKYEIPIDSRITKWLNKFGFPVVLSANALGDRNYYNFVLDGIRQLCDKSGIYPCILDAAIFTSFDK